MPPWLLGALVGLATGCASAFVVAIVQITAKRVRNSIRAKRGEPGIRDVAFTPFYLFFTPVGGVAGGVVGGITGDGVVPAIAAAMALPALLLVVVLGFIVYQVFFD